MVRQQTTDRAHENASGTAEQDFLARHYFLRLRRIFAMYALAAADPFTSRAGLLRRVVARFAGDARRDRAAVLREALRLRRTPPPLPRMV